MMRRKRTDEEEKLLKLLQGMKPQDGFTTWCEQMLHTLNTSANNSSSSLDGRLLSFSTFTSRTTLLPHPSYSKGFLIAYLFSCVFFFCWGESGYNCGLPEGGGVSLCSAGLYPVLLRGHSGSQRVRQTVSGATCQTESQPTETAAAGIPEFVDSFHHTSGFCRPKLNLSNVSLL